ncbi:MAG TPA: serine hydrolase domain-containing protein [Gemmatales bacterium]|nr:serine hydrolase domain-containing protein [Gemmatales bacterium]
MHITLITSLLVLLLSVTSTLAQTLPITGKKFVNYEPIDRAMQEFMIRIGAQAGSVALSKDGKLLFSQGYGWSDKAKLKPTQPDALFRIASVSKPITAAAIKNAIRAGELSYDTKAIEFIGIKPLDNHEIADPRILTITVRQLLSHRGGWDRDKSFDPVFEYRRVERELHLARAAGPRDVIQFMLMQQLQFTPGERSAYSNFGYIVLGRVLEKAMKKPFGECLEESIFKPLKITDIKLGHSSSNKRDPREVWYPVGDYALSMEVMDANGGMIASAPALCQFLEAYWIGGDPRKPGQRGNWTFFGSMPGTTSMARQRNDGYNIAVLLNNRRNNQSGEDDDVLKKAMDKAIDAVKGK